MQLLAVLYMQIFRLQIFKVVIKITIILIIVIKHKKHATNYPLLCTNKNIPISPVWTDTGAIYRFCEAHQRFPYLCGPNAPFCVTL
ncbi:hypothetical protein D3C73_1466640 [compost metagenome]